MPEASPRSVVGSTDAPAPAPPPASRQVSQSCGSSTRLHPGGVGGLVLGQPAQLGDGEGHRRHGAGARRPLGRPAELRDQRRGLRRGLHVVPEHRVPDDRARGVEHHHAVLLRPDADRVRPLQEPAPGRGQRLPPVVRVAFRAVRVRRAGGSDDGPVVGPAQQHFGGLRGGINPCDQIHDRDGSSAGPGRRPLECPGLTAGAKPRVRSEGKSLNSGGTDRWFQPTPHCPPLPRPGIPAVRGRSPGEYSCAHIAPLIGTQGRGSGGVPRGEYRPDAPISSPLIGASGL